MIISNPWLNLPDKSPFIASIDNDYISENDSHLKFEIRPTPYLGNIDTAEIIFLALNPGFVPEDLIWYPKPIFWQLHDTNLFHYPDATFFPLDESLQGSGAYIWWTRILKGLFLEGFSYDLISRKIMCIEYFPYHSVNYKGLANRLPSQEYSFELLRRAIAQNKKIVVMRSEKLWLEAVPELKNIDYIKIKNPRNPTISRANMKDYEFESIIKRLD